MLMLVSVLPIYEIKVKSLLYYPTKVLLDRQENNLCTADLMFTLSWLFETFYMKLSSGNVTSTSEDQLSKVFLICNITK